MFTFLTRLRLIWRNLTGGHRALEALRESEERFRQLAENIRQVFWMTDARKFRVVYVSPAYEEIWGRSCQSLYEQSMSFLDAVHPDDRAYVLSGLDLQKKGESTTREYRLMRPDGSIRWILDRAFPIRNNAGDVYRVAGIAEDITERKRAEERLRLVVEAAPTGMVMIDRSGTIVLANSQMQKMFGYRSGEILGRPVEMLVPPRFRAEHPQFRDNFFRDPQTRAMGAGRDLVGVHKNGSEIPVEIGLNPIIIDREAFVLASIIDVTERKQAEQDLQRAKEAAEAASRAKSEFLANVSHEFRTPLNGILGMTELVLGTELTPKQREYLALVRLSVDSLMAVITDLLDFARIEAGKLELHPAPFRLRGKLSYTLKALALRAHKKGLELSCVVGPDVPEGLVGDADRLCQIVGNLVGNAIKFTEHGKVAVCVEAESRSEHDVSLHLAVADTGIGIPADKQPIIFQPFEQADSSSTRKYEGTGLGLAIVSQLITLMEGQIWVESTVGKGSTFHCTIRFELDPSPTSSVPSQKALEQSLAMPVRTLRVLVIEDNPINRILTLDLLKRRGHTVLVAKTGKEALTILQDHSVDVVVMDVQMPEMNGFDVTARIRERERAGGDHLPIIALTARAMKGDRERCLEAGMDDYISKPVEPEELYAAIERVAIDQPDPSAIAPLDAGNSFDRDTLLERVRGNRVLLGRMIDIFLGICPQWLDRIGTAIQQANAREVMEVAHTLKGSAGTLGAQSVMDAASRLEAMGRSQDLKSAETAFAGLSGAAQQLCRDLTQFAEDLTAAAVAKEVSV